MVTLFFSFLGRWALAVINFYLANQALFNTALVAYGLVLAVSHYNMSSVERFLVERLKPKDGMALLRALAGTGGIELMKAIKDKFRFPFVSSGVDFTFHALRRDSLIRMLGKKQKIPQSEIAELLNRSQ